MAEIEKEEVESLMFNIMWQNLIFNFIMYTVLLFSKRLYNVAHMLDCHAIAIPNTKQIVFVFTNTYVVLSVFRNILHLTAT